MVLHAMYGHPLDRGYSVCRRCTRDDLGRLLWRLFRTGPGFRAREWPPSAEPVAAVVARGEAEIGFQQVSELINVPGVTLVGTIPAELQPEVSFAGALTSNARQPEAARTLIRFLASPEVAATILKAGLTPVSGR